MFKNSVLNTRVEWPSSNNTSGTSGSTWGLYLQKCSPHRTIVSDVMYPDSVNATSDPSGALVSESVMAADILLPLNNTIGGMFEKMTNSECR